MIEPEPQAVPFSGDLSEHGTRIFDALPVAQRAGRETETRSHGEFVGGMNIVGIADVDGYSHRSICHGKGLTLSFAHGRPVLEFIRFEICDLHVEEGKIADRPMIAPVANQGLKERSIVRRTLER